MAKREPDAALDRAQQQRPLGPTPAVQPDLSLVSWGDAERLFRIAREALVPVEQPMVLVSQLQRSGGTFLNRLLDGHPELHVHPYELHIGHPTKYDWPALDLASSADTWLEMLREGFIERLFAEGYRKGSYDQSSLAFTVAPSFLERLFRVLCAEQPPQTPRRVVDHYLTAFFNAWFDCQGLREEPKRWVGAFAPRLAWGQSRTRYFADYPDGRIVTVHRDPRAWYASAFSFKDKYSDFEEALALWRQGTQESMTAKRESPEQVFVLTYEALVREPERVMRTLADWLGIEWNPILLRPTFNRQATVTNSSHGAIGTGIRAESLERWRDTLSPETVDAIEAATLELDAVARAAADAA